jgi:hypothetical protein
MLEGTARGDFNRTNSRILHRLDPADPSDDHAMHEARAEESRDGENASGMGEAAPLLAELHVIRGTDFTPIPPAHSASFLQKVLKWIKIYGRFIGPGFMVGNLWSSAVVRKS